jgi:AmmeMemoRadiSam system protein B
MSTIRQPAVAGMFYPANPVELHKIVTDCLASAVSEGESPKAIIAPHAGYIYSGAVAASAYHLLGQARDKINRVVLLGPSHRVPLQGLAASRADFFATPLGKVPIDKDAINTVLSFSQVQLSDQAHAYEHSLEVQVPFLQEVLGDFSLVPLVVGDATPEEVGEVLDALWGGDETLIVVSSDLSHYHDYATAQHMDTATSKAIESLHPEHIHFEDACGRVPVSGLLQVARQRGMHARTVDLRNSGDTAGPRDQVVGYGAYAFA